MAPIAAAPRENNHPMTQNRRSWQEELDIIDRTMKAVSGIVDPNELVDKYWEGMGELLPGEHYLALSLRDVTYPNYVITRSSRFTTHFNPWTEREKLPVLSGGLLGEIAYADKPVVIDNLPPLLKPDDPAYFYLEGFQVLVASPQYENGVTTNVAISLYLPDEEFDPSLLPLMHLQTSLFGRGTRNLVLRNQLAAALEALDRELKVVGEIQRSLLPQRLPDLPGYEMAAHYETSQRAGGDYYDFFPLKDDECGVFIADVSGHGTPAAVLMAVTHAIAHTRPGMPKPPCEVLAHLNAHLARSYTTDGTFVTAFYAIFNPRAHELVYSTAGHNPPRLVRGDRVLSLDKQGGLPLGIFPTEKYTEASITFQPGDMLVLYTDGITEAMAPPNSDGYRELFGVQRLDEVLLSCRDASPRECIDRIREELTNFTHGAPRADDQTLIAIRASR